MVCCAIISIVLAGLIWPIRILISWFRSARVPPLMWQLSSEAHLLSAVTASQQFSISARLKSVSYAVAGIGFVIRNEHNARIHIAAAITVVMIGAFYHISTSDWLVLLLAIIGVWFAETINTAFEYLCDVVSPQKNEAVRHAKDIAAGAVLITAMGAVIIGIFVLFPYVKADLWPPTESVNFLEIAAANLCAVIRMPEYGLLTP